MTESGLNFFWFFFSRCHTDTCKRPKQACVGVALVLLWPHLPALSSQTNWANALWFARFCEESIQDNSFVRDNPGKVKENVFLVRGQVQYKNVSSQQEMEGLSELYFPT